MAATVHVEFGALDQRDVTSSAFPLAKGAPRKSQTLTSSGSNQVAADTALAYEVATISASGGSIYLAIGPNPDASTNPRRVVFDGQQRDFAVNVGDKVAIKDLA